MIISNRTTKTVKPSTLNNRGVRSTPGKETHNNIDSERVTQLHCWGTLSECMLHEHLGNRGCSLRSYPRLLSEDRLAVSLGV